MNIPSNRTQAAHPGRRLHAVLCLGVIVGFSAPLSRAQEVSVGDPVVVAPLPPPDEAPRLRGKLRPSYPGEMRKTDETGYVIVVRYIDASGTSRVLQAYGTHAPFQRAVEEEYPGWKVSPVHQNGAAVDVSVWIPVIFNPRSAGQKLADASPRLLAVAPVITKEKPTPGNQPPVVRMKLGLDAAGAIIAAEPETSGVNAGVVASIRESLRAWRFAPARKGGEPVAGEITVSVICQPPIKGSMAKMVPPKARKQVPPQYPVAMQRYGLRGAVAVVFEIDTDGSVRNPAIARSDNPAFDDHAIEAILKWKYDPATHDGQPVKTLAQQEIQFQMPGMMEQDAFVIEGRTDQSKLPPELQYDTAAKIRGVQVPVYPADLRQADTQGKARVAMLVDPQGRVAQVKVLEATRPEFGLALTAATEGFRFDPALKNGRPVASLLGFDQDFNDRELPDYKADRLLALEKKHPEKIISGATLSGSLKPVSRRPPVFPVTAATERGSATIEFLVDEDGRARVPRIVKATDPAFGYAAVQAVASWWFEPVEKDGKRVVVRVQIPIEFSPPP